MDPNKTKLWHARDLLPEDLSKTRLLFELPMPPTAAVPNAQRSRVWLPTAANTRLPPEQRASATLRWPARLGGMLWRSPPAQHRSLALGAIAHESTLVLRPRVARSLRRFVLAVVPMSIATTWFALRSPAQPARVTQPASEQRPSPADRPEPARVAARTIAPARAAAHVIARARPQRSPIVPNRVAARAPEQTPNQPSQVTLTAPRIPRGLVGIAASDRMAVDALASGNLEGALALYRALSAQHPQRAVYAQAARILEVQRDARGD